MAKMKSATVYFCQNCGYESSKWMGQCPGCREWNTLVEEVVTKASGVRAVHMVQPTSLNDISMEEEDKLLTHMSELDRVLGGGIVPGQLTLVGGDPGIGKSTILLQMCQNLAADGRKILYISGEESLKQIKIRAMRIGEFTDQLKLLCETDLDTVEAVIKQENSCFSASCQEYACCNIYCRACNKGRYGCGAARTGAYGRYGLIF